MRFLSGRNCGTRPKNQSNDRHPVTAMPARQAHRQLLKAELPYSTVVRESAAGHIQFVLTTNRTQKPITLVPRSSEAKLGLL